MPSKSKAQQRFMGLVHAYNKGDVPASKVSKQVKDVAKSMKKKDTKDFAKTKHKGLPNKVKQEINLETLIKENPAAVAAAVQAMQQMKAANPKTGRVNKMSTALGNKKHPSHKKAKSVFSKIVDKFKKKKKQEPKKQSKSDVDFYKKQFTGEVRKLVRQELNEMSYKGFVKYMNDFYGPKGVYPDKKKRTLKMKDIGTAYSVLLKKKPDFEIGYDSTDREMLRDILIKMRKLDPDYSQKKESVNEVNKSDLKYQLDMSLDNLGIGTKALIAMKPKGKDYFLKMKSYMYQDSMEAVLKDANKVLKSRLKIKNFKKTRMGTEFIIGEGFVNEGKGVEKIMKMANDKSFGKLAGRTVDGMTAQLFKQVYDKAPQNAKDKINKMNEKQLYVFMGKLWSKFGRQVSLR